MKKSEKPITVEYLAKLACLNVDRLDLDRADGEFTREHIELLCQIRNDLVHSGNSEHFSPFFDGRIKSSALYDELKKRLKHGTSLQASERTIKTAQSFASAAHGSETVNPLPAKSAGSETVNPLPAKSAESEMVNSLPPKNAEFLLALLLDKKDQEAAMGCFAELYSKKLVRWGKRRAHVWAWAQVGKTLVPVLKKVVLKVSGLIAAYEWLKHHLS